MVCVHRKNLIDDIGNTDLLIILNLYVSLCHLYNHDDYIGE